MGAAPSPVPLQKKGDFLFLLAPWLHSPSAPPCLQDPSDKSYILADAALKGLTGEARFKGFGLSKLIKDHITGYA